jgi:hypothetical protein
LLIAAALCVVLELVLRGWETAHCTLGSSTSGQHLQPQSASSTQL